jgi:hypothetical protein
MHDVHFIETFLANKLDNKHHFHYCYFLILQFVFFVIALICQNYKFLIIQNRETTLFFLLFQEDFSVCSIFVESDFVDYS